LERAVSRERLFLSALLEPPVARDTGSVKTHDTRVTSGGHFLVTAAESGECRCWDLHTRGLVSVFKGHSQRVTALEVFDGDEAVLSR
jgi:WD40 repeat protein